MRFLFSSMRLTGHIRPLLPYAKALIAKGHEVRFSTPQSAAKMIAESGLSHAHADFPDLADLESIFAAMKELPEAERQKIVCEQLFAGRYARAALPSLRKTITNFKPDLIVRETMEFGSVIAAAEANIPIAQVATTTTDFEAFIRQMAIPTMDQFRQDVGLAPDQGRAMIDAPTFTSFPSSFDNDVVAPAEPQIFRVGAKRLAKPKGPLRPEWENVDKRPLVFVSLGTLAAHSDQAPAVLRNILEAVSKLSIEVVLSKGSSLTDEMIGTTPSNVSVVDWVPEEEIFPIIDGMICHGGAGTLIAGMTNAVPMVVIPLGNDQPTNAKRIQTMGSGVAILKPETDNILGALNAVLQDQRIRKTADDIADEIARLPNYDAAADALLSIARAGTLLTQQA